MPVEFLGTAINPNARCVGVGELQTNARRTEQSLCSIVNMRDLKEMQGSEFPYYYARRKGDCAHGEVGLDLCANCTQRTEMKALWISK